MTRRYVFQCHDREVTEPVNETSAKVLEHFALLKQMTLDDDEDDESDVVLPLPEIDAHMFRDMWRFTTHIVSNPLDALTAPLSSDWRNLQVLRNRPWLVEFTAPYMAPLEKTRVDNHDPNAYRLVYLIEASKYVDHDVLLEYAALLHATLLCEPNTPATLRAKFGIPEPTPQQEREMRERNKWVFNITPPNAEAAVRGMPASTPVALQARNVNVNANPDLRLPNPDAPLPRFAEDTDSDDEPDDEEIGDA